MANIDEKDSRDNRNLNELDAVFSTLDLVNSSDIDVYLKVIMSVDEKTAQNIRGELNHLVAKYIDADPVLKEKLIRNCYDEYNQSYLRTTCKKIHNSQLDTYIKNVSISIINIIENSDLIDQVFNIIGTYIYGLINVKNFLLPENESDVIDAFIRSCSALSHFDKDMVRIHTNICKIMLLLNPGYDHKSAPVTSLSYKFVTINNSILIGVCFKFTNEVPPIRNIPILIHFKDLSTVAIERFITFYNKETEVKVKLEDTLDYIAKNKNDD